jgi:glycerol-3-phosphate O-acyltransferase / dihydroxyacetone phosphate acyltransferase
MFYKFLKILVGFSLKIFFKKIFVSGIEHIKIDKPQLIASNHPNGFLEPLIMACYFPKDLHFLVRGDVFDKKWLRPILISTHQIPIFRFRDGFSKLRENAGTMDESFKILMENKNLLIFAEGGTESVKKLRPLQKGIARIAFQVLEKDPELDLEIIPTGINFTYPTRFNKEVMLQVGEPIKVKPYFALYLTDKNKAIDQLLSDIYQRMLHQVVHLDDQTRMHLFEDTIISKRASESKALFPILCEDSSRFNLEKTHSDNINQLDSENLDQSTNQIKLLKTKAKHNGIKWTSLNKKKISLIEILIILIGALPSLLGYVSHMIPLIAGKLFTKAKVSQKEFKASILFVITLLFIIIWYIIMLSLILIFEIPIWWLAIIFLCGLFLKVYYTILTDNCFYKCDPIIEIHKDVNAVL